MRIFGVVVLFHPPPDLERNIRSYLDWVEELLVIDNTSPSVVTSWRVKFPQHHVQWHANTENQGIAEPWNRAAKWAVEQNADWLLVMDQDSYFESGACEKWRPFLVTDRGRSAGIIAPIHLTGNEKKSASLDGVSDLRFVMGSGCLVNLAAYRTAGPFSEKLFLDLVDHEYCLRLRKHGYAVLRMNEVLLQHRLGEPTTKGVFSAVNHAAIRKYYRSRNRLLVMFQYLFFDPRYFLFELRSAMTDVVKIILLDREKRKSFRYFFLGVWHAMIGRFGRLHS